MTAIQGDTTGSRVGAGAGQTLATAWDSGELVIQSRNASFGLVYAGSVDIEGLQMLELFHLLPWLVVDGTLI